MISDTILLLILAVAELPLLVTGGLLLIGYKLTKE